MAMARKRKALDLNHTRLADLTVAVRTVGDTSAARLEWVVNFSREEPRLWHSAERAARGDCLVALANHWTVNQVAEADGSVPAPLSPSAVDALHATIRQTLHALVRQAPGQPVMFSTQGVAEGLVRTTAVGKSPAEFVSTYGHRDVETALLHVIKDLVLRAGDRLLACPAPDCQEAFIKIHKTKFCSKDCGQRSRNTKKAKLRYRKRGN
jgi:hypothetical protein